MSMLLPPQNRGQSFSLQVVKSDLPLAQKNVPLLESSITVVPKNFALLGNLPVTGLAVITVLSIGLLGSVIVVGLMARHTFRQLSYLRSYESKSEKKLQEYLQKDLTSLPWYDLPRWGQKSALQHFLKSKYKPSVPEGASFLHRTTLDKIGPLAQKLISIDDEKFKGKEFIAYLKIRTPYEDGPNRDDDLCRSAELLKVALETSSYFDQIWQVEFRYISSKQKEYYRFVDNLLAQKNHGKEFREKLRTQLDATLPDIVSEEGQNVLKSYAEALRKLSENELGLELLSLFKQFQLADFVVLKTVSQLFGILKNEDLSDDKMVLAEVMKHYSTFERLAPIIQMPTDKMSPENFANLVYFCVLEMKHRASYSKFEKLISILKEWQKSYQTIIGIRSEYDPQTYRQPQEFSIPVPGVDIHQKYIMWMLN